MSTSEVYARWRYRLIPDHVLGEILSKTWIDNAIPFVFLIAAIVLFGAIIPDFFMVGGLTDQARELGEIIFVTLGMAIVMLAGGIDLSVGSTFALSNFITLALFNWQGWPIGLAILCALLSGALVGLINGILVGYLRLRAFLTTLVTLIIVRAIDDILVLKYSTLVVIPKTQSDIWDFIGDGDVYGVPVAFIAAILIAVAGHIFLTRLRPGWHVLAVGGSRRSAHNAGIPVRRTVATTYVISGIMAAAAGVFYPSRVGATGGDTGVGLEVTALTAAVLGGNSLGGGRGSVTKALLGALIVMIINNGLVRLGFKSGAGSVVLGIVLLIAVAIDVRWLKNRAKVLSRVYVSPAYFKLPPCPSTAEGSASPYALNDKLKDVALIGLGEIDAAEDPILDINDDLFSAAARATSSASSAPTISAGRSMSMSAACRSAWRSTGPATCLCCVAGMGLYKIVKDTREIVKLTDETTRSWLSIIDDSRMRLPDDLDVAPDGRIFFSEATIRFDVTNGWSTGWKPGATAGSSATTRATSRRGPCCRRSSSRTASASPMTASRSSSPAPGAAPSNATGWRVPGKARSRPSSPTFPAIPTTSTGRRTATIGWPWPACGRRRSISHCASPASAAAWCSASRRTSGCSRR